nr:G protein-coupled receptor [Proales similis]
MTASDLKPWQHDLVGWSILTIGLVGMFVNVKFVISFWRKSRRSDGEVNPLLLNMAVTNIGIILLAFPLSGWASFVHKWPWGHFWCTYYGSISLFFGFGLMMIVILLTIDVYLKYNSYFYGLHRQAIRKLLVVWIWLNSLFWAVAPLLGWSQIGYEPCGTSCTVDVMNPNMAYISYIVCCFVCCYVMPLFVLTYCRFKALPNKENSDQELNQDLRKTLLVVLLFVIEWTPYSAVYLWPIFDDPKNIPVGLSALAPVFAKLSVVLTPLVYWSETKPQAIVSD